MGSLLAPFVLMAFLSAPPVAGPADVGAPARTPGSGARTSGAAGSSATQLVTGRIGPIEDPPSVSAPGPASMPGPGDVPGPTSVPGPGDVPGPTSAPVPGGVPGPTSVPGPGGVPGPTSVPGPAGVPGPGEVPAQADPPLPGALLARCQDADLVLTRLRLADGRVHAYGVARFAPGTPILLRDAGSIPLALTVLRPDGRFAVSTPLSGPVETTKLYAQSFGVRSRRLRLQRSNQLDEVRRSGTRITVTGRVARRFRGGHPQLRVLGGRELAGCHRPGTLEPTSAPRFDPRSGRYLLRVRVPAGRGRVVLRVRLRQRGGGTTYSAFVTR